MWYLAEVGLFVVGALCGMVAEALVLDITITNRRRGLRWLVRGRMGMGGYGLGGFCGRSGRFRVGLD